MVGVVLTVDSFRSQMCQLVGDETVEVASLNILPRDCARSVITRVLERKVEQAVVKESLSLFIKNPQSKIGRVCDQKDPNSIDRPAVICHTAKEGRPDAIHMEGVLVKVVNLAQSTINNTCQADNILVKCLLG